MSKKKLTKEELADKLTKLQAERESLFKKQKPINKGLELNYREIEATTALLQEIELQDHSNNLAVLLDPKNLNCKVMHNARENWCKGKDMMFSCYFPGTGQPCAQLRINKDQPIDNLLAIVKELIPHYIPVEDGFVIFGILEHTLSEHGVFQLNVKPDLLSAKITKTVYGRKSDKKTGTLEECLSFMSENVWYTRGKDEDYEDDDAD